MTKSLKTAECVTPKHPDKMCDQISDAILDFCLAQDENSRVAIEVLGGHGQISIMGEVTFNGEINHNDIIPIVEKITGKSCSFLYKDKELHLSINIVKQSPEIANGVDTGGAGDQGIMIGYACRDNDDFIPQELYLARLLAKTIYAIFPFDGKTQITLNEDGLVDTVVASFQNAPKEKLEELIMDFMLQHQVKCIPNYRTFCNPAGDWEQGGFDADTGLTGRKLMVDNYGPQVSIGGGCFSGKDATKVDRSAAYMARKIAVDLIKLTENVDEVIVKLAYAIGVAEPVMAVAELRSGAGELVRSSTINLQDETWAKVYDLTPKGIINFLNLKEPQFEKTAQWGHFGNSFKWDR